jgi:methionyl-tRNA synthetase
LASIFNVGWSLGNVIDPYQLIDKFGLDATRFFLLREVAFGSDGDFSENAMTRRLNQDLANDLGNLAQRILSFIAKNTNGNIPAMHDLNALDKQMLEAADTVYTNMQPWMEQLAFHRALEAAWHVVGEANRYIDARAPWTLKKTDPQSMETVLAVIVHTLYRLGVVLYAGYMQAAIGTTRGDRRECTRFETRTTTGGNGIACSYPPI